MISIHVRNPYIRKVSKKRIIQVVKQTLIDQQQDESIDLSILVCSDLEITNLNKMYRQIDQPTDVLSFTNNEIDPETNSRILGDIVVSFDTAYSQAQQAKNDLQTEIDMLIIHGVLHLLGFDHDDVTNKSIMWKNQYKLHKKLGIIVNSLPGEND